MTRHKGIQRRTCVTNEVRDVIKLPNEITTILDRIDELKARAPEHPAPVQRPEAAVASGTDPVKAHDDYDAYERAVAEYKRAQRTTQEVASRLGIQTLPATEAKLANEIIEGPIRDAVDEIMVKARKYAAGVQRFWPEGPFTAEAPYYLKPSGYDSDWITQRATAAELKAYQDAQQLQRQFSIIVGYVHHLNQHQGSTIKGGTPGAEDHPFLPLAYGGDAVWQRPELVEAAWIRGQAFRADMYRDDTDPAPMFVLTLGTVAEDAGFQFQSPRELRALHERRKVEEERQKRSNWIPGGFTGGESAFNDALQDIGISNPTAPRVTSERSKTGNAQF